MSIVEWGGSDGLMVIVIVFVMRCVAAYTVGNFFCFWVIRSTFGTSLNIFHLELLLWLLVFVC